MPGALSIFPLLLVIHYYAPTTTSQPSYVPTTTSQPVFNCRIYSDCIYGDLISYGETANSLTSDGGTFRLGFFERGSNAYLGIWYGAAAASPDEVIVWVANRDNPIPLQSRPRGYFFRISDDGNAEVFDSDNRSYWSTNHSSTPSSAEQMVLQLLNTGNLILVDGGSGGGKLWQSFENPSDTFLPGMNITRPGLALVSWKGPQDPAKGNYSFQKGDKSLFIYNAATPYWKRTFSSLHPNLTSLLSSLNPNLTSLLSNNMTGNSSALRLVMNYTGSVELWELQEGYGSWSMKWWAPRDRCDELVGSDTCGTAGVCDAGNIFRCKCLPGYVPNDPGKWESEDFSSGCSKRTTNQCGQVLLPLPMVKLPPGPEYDNKESNETVCRDLCLGACGCRAYSFDANQSRCRYWTDLTRIQEESTHGQTLYIRVNQSDIELGSRTCSICGTNLVPYPLSTGQNCGDPSYFSFQCNTTNGQVYFKPPSGQAYKVSLINLESRTFYIQLATASTSDTCNSANIESKEFNLNNTSPFSVTSCRLAPLNAKQVVVVMLSWKPPPPPACKSSVDCRDWPDTTCDEDMNGKNVCMCAKGFDWDSLFMNCTKGFMPPLGKNPVSAPDHKHIPLSLGAGVAAASGIVLLLLGSFLFILRLRRRRAIQRAGLIDQFKTDDIEDIEIPFIDYQIILDVTDNFSDSNKLGAGGFGPVYKGKLPNGNEVAVKRLSRASVQGIEEFRNEVILIAKLQHRNLVRVLGYCMKEDEKILIYEYMPNKCLSSFIFDQTTSPLLDWTKRFNIILGIARGLVYLHQDSRLRIIHRDLKPSNILLDEELNPKISDFGLAKIVAGNEIATSTARVVGTYGYMSPEYALDGYFSIKSDVYSFGIILLEVISGRKCTRILQFDNILISLLGYAWTLWDKERALELVDKSIVDSCDSFEVKRCINVGLLCVQEDPSDRPTMSTVLLMLGGGDAMSLPHPNQPVFVARRPPLETASSSSSKFGTSNSNAELSTTLEGR